MTKTKGQKSNDKTILERMPVWVEAALDNLDAIARTPTVDLLRGVAQGVPAIQVAPGPSLDKNVLELKRAKGHCVMIALAHAMPRLTAEGITPDIVICCETIDQSMYLEGADWAGISALVLVAQSNPSMFALPARRTLVYTSNISTEWLETGLGVDCSLIAGNTTASVAWGLAHLMGCAPVVLVGHDLTWTGKKKYADGITGLELFDRGMKFPGYPDGKTTLTSVTFGRQAQWFEARAAEGNHIVNATEGGLIMKGLQYGPLRDVVDEHRKGVKGLDVEALIGERLHDFDKDASARKLRSWTATAVKDIKEATEAAREVIDDAKGISAIRGHLAKLTRNEERMRAALVKCGWLECVTAPVEANEIEIEARGVSEMLETYKVMGRIAEVAIRRGEYLIPRLRAAGVTIGKGA